MLARVIASKVVDLFYPERCVHCGAFGAALCLACEAAMEPAVGAGRCRNCCARWAGEDNCPRCYDMQHLDGVLAAVEMAGSARHVVHALKYRGVRSLAAFMAARVSPLAERQPVDAAFPVPLHRSRMRSRGFNQSALILSALGWPRTVGELRRVRRTDTQVGLHLGERRANVSGAFRYEGPSLEGRTVGIIDDVVTTGATANECAGVLREHGARYVYAFAFARANYDPKTPTLQIVD